MTDNLFLLKELDSQQLEKSVRVDIENAWFVWWICGSVLQSNEATFYLFTSRKGAAANRRLTSGEVGRWWEDSNPRPPRSNAATLSAGPPQAKGRVDQRFC